MSRLFEKAIEFAKLRTVDSEVKTRSKSIAKLVKQVLYERRTETNIVAKEVLKFRVR